MTDEQRDIIIAKMIDAPAALTDEELRMIASDAELSDIQAVSAAVSGAYARKPTIDIEDEWSRFKKRIPRKPSIMLILSPVAAIFMGAAMISSIFMIIINHKATPESAELLAENQQIQESANRDEPDSVILTPEIKASAKPLASNRANRSKSASMPKKQHPVSAVDETPVTNITDEIDVDEYLRIQQAMIDNDIAMLNAEILLDEYTAIQQMFDFFGEHDPLLETTIQKVTMQ